jgi:hypothetical protein
MYRSCSTDKKHEEMMSVTRTNETFVNKCMRCHFKWRAVVNVDIIDWDNNTSSLVASNYIECPKCRKTSPIKKINDKYE